MSFKKNTAVIGFSFGLVSKTDGSDVTTGTTNGFVTIDGGTQTALTNSPSHAGNGQWEVDLTAAEMNGDIIGLVFTNTSAITKQVTISTEAKLVSELNDFDNTIDQVIVTTNNDKTGYSISGTKNTLDSLNDIAATDIVSTGAINTSGGAVSTVTTVTNTTSANVVSISGDTVAADNLESQYDGTGLIGDNYPSSQKQVSSLAVGAGGYENNSVYVDTTNGVDGTQIGVNGTINNPVLTMATARTIADNAQVNSNRIVFDKGTDLISLDQDYQRFVFSGRNPTPVNLNNNDVSLSSFVQMVVTGTCTNTTGVAVYDTCGILDLVCGESNFVNCGLVGSLTLNQSGTRYNADRIWTNAAVGDVPEIIFNGDGVSSIELDVGYLSGSYVVKGMTSVDKLSLGGNAYIFLDASNSGGVIEASGDIYINDSVPTTPPTITKGVNSRTLDEVREIKGVGWTDESMVSLQALVEDIPNTSEFEARTLPSASYFDFTSDQVIVATNNDKTGYSISGTKTTLDNLNDVSTGDIFTTTLTEDYAADGTEFNLTQGLYLAVQNLQDFVYSGVTQTVRKLDGTTTAATYTLDDAVTPTSKTRAT